jgi:hypothetical protein
MCGAEYSDFEEIPFCENRIPAIFPPLYAIHLDSGDDRETTGVVDFREQENAIESGTSATYLWTGGNDEFTSQVMGRFLRRPDLASAFSNPKVASGIQVR